MRLLLLITTLSVLTSCAQLPSPPQGSTCVGDVIRGGFVCVPIQTAIRRGEVLKRDASSFVPFKDVDNWIAFSPKTWENIQVYIGELKQLARENCSIP